MYQEEYCMLHQISKDILRRLNFLQGKGIYINNLRHMIIKQE